MSNYGTVNFEGKTYDLTQQAYATNYRDGVRYEAKAIGEDGAEYIVAWETTSEWDEANEIMQGYYNHQGEMTDEESAAETLLQDESNACDWDNPVEVEAI